VVVYLFCDNDPHDNLVFEGGGRHPRWPRLYRSLPRVILRRHSILVWSLLTRRLRHDRWPGPPTDAGGDRGGSAGDSTEGAKTAALQCTLEMRRLAGQRGARFFVSFVNFRISSGGTVHPTETAREFREAFNEAGVETVSPIEFLEPYVNDWERFRGEVPFMGHFSARGYRGYAEALAEAILTPGVNSTGAPRVSATDPESTR
jgi:hypothetical protein